jgi:hypothetical protein
MQSNAKISEKICQGHSDKARPRSFFAKAADPCFYTVLASTYFFFILELLALKMNGALAVPDLELSLLDSNFVEPKNLQLLFRPSRKYVASTHFIHIQVPFNFSQLILTLTLILNEYHRYIKKWTEPLCTQVEEVAEISHSCLADKLNDFVDALPQYTPVLRDKRLLNLIALGMSAATVTLSTFNSARISTLETEILNNKKLVDHLVDLTKLHEQHFKAVDQKLDDISDKLTTLIKINKVHFVKMMDFMEQKLGTAVTISDRLIHMAYSN